MSGFLPVQSVYADIFVLDALWPDFEPQHLDELPLEDQKSIMGANLASVMGVDPALKAIYKS